MNDDAHEHELPPQRPTHGPRPAHGRRAARRDTESAWVGNLIFLLGTLFGMGLMWLITDMLPPDEDPGIAHYKEVRQLLLDTYVARLDPDEVTEDAIEGMFTGLEERFHDDYSRYYLGHETAVVDRDTTGHFLGIGVVFRGGTEAPQVLFPVEDGPAARAGMRVGDTLVAIEGESLAGRTYDEVVPLLRGQAGQTLHVEVEGLDGARRALEVVLQSLIDPSVRHVELVDAQRGIGYLALVSFSNETPRQFDEAVTELQRQGMRGLVIDLRGNRGGVLAAAVEVTQRFVHEGRITSTEGRGAPEFELARPELAKYAGLPLVLLVDEYTASASEVLAGALQDHRAAVLVGVPTYGKGMVQTIHRYPERDAIAKVTSSFYYTPAHRNLEAHFGHDPSVTPRASALVPGDDRTVVGLIPDVLVPADDRTRERMRDYLHGTFSPPAGALPALRAWERSVGQTLLTPHPEDRQLEAALRLFRGEHPGSLAHAEDAR
ncbi:MAG: PDZ domain-containing protein [Planctomycetes bacterium]|nr:PDZ domain-containing protein [Planctomycetota bacterium]